MSRERRALDAYAKKIIGFERKVTSHGEEVFALNIEAALCLLLKAADLHELAREESVKIAWTADGA